MPEHGRSAHLLHESGVADDDELVTSAGKPDVQPLSGPLHRLALVEREDDRGSFESLEAEDVTVEDLVRVPERVPVRVLTDLLSRLLLWMPAAGGEQGKVLGSPPLVQEYVDLVLCGPQRLAGLALDEPDLRSVDLAETHPDRGQRGEAARDLAGVAEVDVQDQGDESCGRSTEPGEHTLPLVGEHVEAAGVLDLQCREHCRPPEVGEVLRLIDDDGVERLPGRLLRTQLDHQLWQLDLPEVAVVVAAGRRAPLDPE